VSRRAFEESRGEEPQGVRVDREALVDGRYELLELLGRGGMAEVYRAWDSVLRRDVALKFLDQRHAREEEFVERFRREAESAAALSHPNIVQVYDRGRSERGAHYMSMEYVPGGTLKERVLEQGALPIRTSVGVAMQIADALQEAHDRGVLHRDVKPQNVLVTARGGVKVSDFGLARISASARVTQATRPGLVLGTASYMAPERALGEPATPGSDLYSLGVILHEMLTGELPFSAEGPLATSMKHVNEPLKPLLETDSRLPAELGVLVERLMAKQPGDRYETAADLAEDLSRLRIESPAASDGSRSVGPLARGATGLVAPPENLGAGKHPPSRGALLTKMFPVRSRQGESIGQRRKRRRVLGRVAMTVLAVLVLTGLAGWSMSGQTAFRVASPDQALGTGNSSNPDEASTTETVTGPTEAAGSPGEAAFVHRAAPENISSNSTYLNNPLANGNPDAFISVTQNWNPGDNGTYNDHPVGVWYDAGEERWAIFNQDRATMPDGASFNVTVVKEPGGS
jgi:serine/threonine protein kinase